MTVSFILLDLKIRAELSFKNLINVLFTLNDLRKLRNQRLVTVRRNYLTKKLTSRKLGKLKKLNSFRDDISKFDQF